MLEHVKYTEMDQDALDYLEANGLEVPTGEELGREIEGVAVWELRKNLKKQRPYVISDFEHKYFIPEEIHYKS